MTFGREKKERPGCVLMLPSSRASSQVFLAEKFMKLHPLRAFDLRKN
jgi:hypothetical protein